ncbi:MAG: hypothetical protein JWO71_4006 [Candidatus Acidoferrum typicum]|nr:hypothetical protein [Candidatus Acidoferrum typicum]
MKGYVLGGFGAFKVGEIAAAVPPGNAIFHNGVFYLFRIVGGLVWRHFTRQYGDWRSRGRFLRVVH